MDKETLIKYLLELMQTQTSCSELCTVHDCKNCKVCKDKVIKFLEFKLKL